MRYGIGLDIGIASVGFASVLLDEDDKPYRLLDIGARTFDIAEGEKGKSAAAERRMARGARRRLRRRAHRKERIRGLFIKSGLLTEDELCSLYSGNPTDIYELRAAALDRLLKPEEFARILLHLTQRRGFKSNRKNAAESKEAGLLLLAVAQNCELLCSKGYRTAGEMLYKDPYFAQVKRNKGESYKATVSRDMIEDEAHALFAAQRSLGAAFATKAFEKDYCEILLSQRPFDLGPGGDSPYGGDQIFKMWGMCTLEPTELRAAKACYSFEYFTLLTKIVNMRIINEGESERLTAAQQSALISLAHKTADISYGTIRELLHREFSLPETARFGDINYDKKFTAEEMEKKQKFNFLKAYHKIRQALDKIRKGYIIALSRDKLDKIGMIFTLYKSDDKIIEKLTEAEFDKIEIEALLTLPGFSKSGHLCTNVCNKLIPHLEKGLNYSEACYLEGYDHKAHTGTEKSKLISLYAAQKEMENTITSPVVKRALSQAFKVINALIRKYDESPVYINIENARELAKSADERSEIEREMKKNAADNELRMAELRDELGFKTASGFDLVKYKLYKEQGGVCVYSQKPIDISQLLEPGYVDVDHIVPYSISFDDSYTNKVLVFSSENRQKGNRLPLEYLTGEKRDRFIVWVNNTIHNNKKRQRLLKKQITEEDVQGFKQRNLTDTQTISTFLANYIADNLAFAPLAKSGKIHVHCVKGAITSLLRKRWGFSKIRANGDTHHALDAVVIACTTLSMINTISAFSYESEIEYMQKNNTSYAVNTHTGEIKREFPHPWKLFRHEIEARFSQTPAERIRACHIAAYSEKELQALTPIFVSRAVRRSIKGKVHDDTVRRSYGNNESEVTSKVPLSKLKLKNGDIEGYFRPEDDKLLYEALKARLLEFNGDGSKAFPQNAPFYKPKADGTNGPIVKKVKVCEKSVLNVPVQNGTGAAKNANGSMVRIDVFYAPNEGYYLVPIYIADTLKSRSPNKAPKSGAKTYADWPEMKEENFVFSLYPNDLVYIESKRPISFKLTNKDSTLEPEIQKTKFYAYYNNTDTSTASITVFDHDQCYTARGLGIKTIPLIRKCAVDILGNISFCKNEKRQGFDK